MISAAYVRRVHRFFLAATVLLSAATLAAQMPGGGGTPNPGGPPQGPTGGAAGAPGAPGAAAANMPDEMNPQIMADQGFVRNTLQNDEEQIRLSQLAQQKSTSPDVQQFSQQTVKIHSELDTQLQPAAKQLGVDTPKGPSKKEKKEIDKMQALSGQDFDTAYLENMGQVQRESLKQFHNEARDSQNSSLRDAASQDTDPLTQNYQMLQKVAQAHNVDLESNKKK